MLMLLRRLTWMAVVGLIVGSAAVGQASDDAPDVVAASLRAERLLQRGEWSAAERLYDSLSQFVKESSDPSLFVFGRGKAQYYGGRLREAIRSFDEILVRFPRYRYAQYAAYFSGNCQFRLGELRESIRRHIEAYLGTTDFVLQKLVVASLSALDPKVVQSVVISIEKPQIKPSQQNALAAEMADALDQHVQKEGADFYRSWRDSLTQESPRPIRRPVAPSRLLRVAVLVPLSGDLQAFGEDLYNGAVIGVSSAQEEYSTTIQLTPFDTKGDPIAAARLGKDISAQSFDAIIGPLTSDEAGVVSAALGCEQFPIIIPAATEAGLTLLSSGSFQLTPNSELQGAIMAEYAVRSLAADSAAVIAPTSNEFAALTKAFIERFKSLGGTIVAIEQYRDRDKDFVAYIRDIKNVILGRIPDSAVYLDDRGDTLETEAVPAHVDCLYLPGSPERVRQLLTQLRFYNLTATYLGSDSWGDESIYNLSADVTLNAVFPSAFVVAASNAAYSSFAKKFAARYGKKPLRVASLGYDAVQLLAAALVRSGSTQGMLTASLQQTSAFEGASGRVTFGTHRENIELPLYRIAVGRPVMIELTPAILESIRNNR